MTVSSPESESIGDEYHQYETNITPLHQRYQFIKHLQNGSFGKVSHALDLVTHEEVSIKSISKLNNTDATVGPCVETAMNEIKILKMINEKIPSINVCKLLNSFEIDNYIIIVLEYCSQGDLYDLIHRRSLQLFEIVKLSNQISQAILECHSIGIYHRDIKPENILIDSNSNFKLCDWGLATTNRINNEFNVGTEKYMAPECFLKNPVTKNYYITKYDCKYSDYWSIGITLLTSIFGTCPFKSTSNSSIQFDYNFKNFVNYNNPYILYDIYSSMNTNCFEMFMNLLKVGNDDDDLSVFESKYRKRDLVQFLNELNSKYVYGFTVDDIDDIETLNAQDNIDDGASLFEMDHDDLQFMTNSAKSTITSVDFDSDPQQGEEEEDDEYLLLDYNKNHIPIHHKTSCINDSEKSTNNDDAHSKLPPSLIESSVKSTKSWCDFDDDDELDMLNYKHHDDFNYELINNLSISDHNTITTTTDNLNDSVISVTTNSSTPSLVGGATVTKTKTNVPQLATDSIATAATADDSSSTVTTATTATTATTSPMKGKNQPIRIVEVELYSEPCKNWYD